MNRKKQARRAANRAGSPAFAASTVTSASSAVPDEAYDTVVIEPEILVADELMRKGEFGDAESLYHQVLKTNPGSLPATIGFGLALAKQFKLPAARAQFEKALKMNPNNAMAYAGLAVMYNSLQSSGPSNKSQSRQDHRRGFRTMQEGSGYRCQNARSTLHHGQSLSHSRRA
ncbi:MAG: tetratricopeptide repeat protein [Cyanobacteriota/Melainabacteria group bacterium]